MKGPYVKGPLQISKGSTVSVVVDMKMTIKFSKQYRTDSNGRKIVTHLTTALESASIKANDPISLRALVMIGTIEGTTVQIDSWLMSCRVLRRGFEETMLDQFLDAARERGLTKVTGRYIPTRKNGMVGDLYARLGFDRVHADSDGTTSWELDLTEPQTAKERWIRIVDGQQQPTSPRRASL